MLRFYVIGLSFDKTHFTFIWVDLECVYILQETTVQDQVLKPSSLFKKSSKECNFIKTRQLVDSFSTPPIYRGLRISEFNSDFLGIRESIFGPSFLLTLDIENDCFKSRKTGHKLHKHWTNSVQENCDRRQGSWPSSSLSLEEVAVYLHRRVLWPSIFLIFIVWMNWRTL